MEIIDWDGETITKPGVYRGIPLKDYHHNTLLLSGPSVSKSALKNIAPPDGNPKKFWSMWSHNPDRIETESTKALNFGRAVHCKLLGDEVFEDSFVIRPEKVDGEFYHGNRSVWKRWYREQAELGLTVITADQMEWIARMATDAAWHPLVQSGGLLGDVEMSYFWKDPETGIWLRARPDVMAADGLYVDLKTASSLDPGFLSRQVHDAGYYLQGAMTRLICRELGLPFHSFTFFYALSEGYNDCDFRTLSDEDMDLGEGVIRYGLRAIRDGLDSGIWPGVGGTYTRENIPIRMNDFPRNRIADFLKREGIL